MSRLASLLIVLLAIAVATPVLAEDRLSLNGEMRVRGWHVDVDGEDNTETWADQRLRIGGKFSVAEGVSVTFRMDATESNWGVAGQGAGSGRLPNVGTQNPMQWDRAHLDIEKNNLHLRAGQQYVTLGKTAFDAQDNGLMLNVKGQIPVSVFFMVDNDGGSRADADGYFYGANVAHKTDAYAANVFVGGQKKSSNVGEEVYVLGLNYAQNFDALKLFAEANYFTGDASETVDAYGLQFFGDVSSAVSETVTVGGQFFYAMGDDEDAQYIILGNDFGGWDPIQALGTNLDNEQITLGRPFNLLGDGAGIMAGRLYGSFKVASNLTLGASVFYGVNDEEDAADFEDALVLAGGLSYAVMANTKLGLQLQYWDFAGEGANDDLEAMAGGVGLFVSF